MGLRDQLSGVFWVAISCSVCVMSAQAGIGTIQFPGPGFIPFWSGVILGTLSIILVITSILKKKAEGEITNLWSGIRWRRVVVILASLFIYVLLLSELGFLIATFGLLTLLFSMIGRPRLWIQVLKALITVLVTYVVFYLWLDIPFPKGILGF